MGAIACFSHFVPPFFLPLYSNSTGLSNANSALILEAWNISSAVGYIAMGLGADTILGPINSLLLSLIVFGLSVMVLWPLLSSLALLLAFSILNGVGSGGFFSLMPVVARRVFGSALAGNALSMLVTA